MALALASNKYGLNRLIFGLSLFGREEAWPWLRLEALVLRSVLHRFIA